MFKREDRYTVFKNSDVHEALGLYETDALIEIGDHIEGWRASEDKPPLKCVVVEEDWPEYEIIWKMIEKRMDEAGRVPE